MSADPNELSSSEALVKGAVSGNPPDPVSKEKDLPTTERPFLHPIPPPSFGDEEEAHIYRALE